MKGESMTNIAIEGEKKPDGGAENIDADIKTADPAVTDQAAAAEEEAVVEFEGEKFTAAQIQEALETKKNQSDWITKNQQEAERLNILSRTIEEARRGLTNPSVGTQQSSQQVPQGNNAVTMKTAEEFRDSLLGDTPQDAVSQMQNYINSAVSKHTNETEAKNAFMTAHPDYLQTINSPEYKSFKSQSPLGNYLNDVNGYYEYKSSATGNNLKEAQTKGFSDGEKKALANQTAKANLKVLNSGGGVSIPSRASITPKTSHVDVLNAATQFLAGKRANE